MTAHDPGWLAAGAPEAAALLTAVERQLYLANAEVPDALRVSGDVAVSAAASGVAYATGADAREAEAQARRIVARGLLHVLPGGAR